MTPLLEEYLELLQELFCVRSARELTQDEEADYSMKLYDCRQRMSESEENVIATLVRITQQRWSSTGDPHGAS